MVLSKDQLLTLERLGLSPNQAKVYLALAQVDSASVKIIEKISGVPREEVYRKLRELQKLGFIECFLSKPKTCRAAPLETVINTMLHHKSEEISNLQLKTEELIQDFKKTQKNNNIKTDSPEVCFIPQQRPLLERAAKELDSLNESLETICSWDKGIGWLSAHLNHFKDALNRKVKIRFIIENSKRSKLPKLVKELQKNQFFKLRQIFFLPQTCLGIYDQKKCSLTHVQQLDS